MTERRPKTDSELVELIRSIDVRAPESVHESVRSMIDAGGGRRRGGASGTLAGSLVRPRLAATGALAALALALVLAFTLGGGSGPAPTVRQAAAVTLRPATAPAPRESAGNRAMLAAAVDGVSFPYWKGHLGWRSTGERSDRIAGRRITTVFYADTRGRQVGYAIVSGTPAPRLPGGATAWRAGVPYRLASMDGVPVITWLRAGHLCVVSGRGVDAATLLRLASWAPQRSLA